MGAWLRLRSTWLISLALYLGAAVLLLVRLGHHPGFAYNWESYTAWEVFSFWDHPSRAIFNVTDGLMTDSGNSPLIALPVWLSFKLFGIGLTQLRLPVVLIVAPSVPLTWLIGRRLVGPWPALMGALLLGLSPVFLLYGRTATLVGISLTPALLTIYALVRVLQEDRAWRWLIALQVLLVLDAYAYAPIRFLWPLSLILFVAELIWRWNRRRWTFACLLLSVLALPLVLLAIDRPAGNGLELSGTIVHYYHARGEQLLSFQQDPQAYDYFLRLTPAEQKAGKPEGSTDQLAFRLVRQNASDYLHLLADAGTRPAITDYWNPHGRLYPKFLVPLFLLGLLWSLLHLGRVEHRIMQVMFWGFGLPLLLTSRVHIGRLIFVVPWLMLFVALGAWLILRWVTRAARRVDWRPLTQLARWSLPVAASLILLAAVARSTWVDYRVAVPPTQEANLTTMLNRDLPALRARGGNAVLLLAEDPSQLQPEEISAAAIRLALGNHVPFVDLSPVFAADPPAGTTAVYYGGLLFGRLRTPALLPTYCQNTYYLPASLLAKFKTVTQQAASQCHIPLRYEIVSG